MTTLQLTEALRGGEALVSGRNSQETCVIKVASLEDASKFVLCSAKPNSRQTVIDAQITLNFTFAKSNGLKNNSLVDVTEVKKVLKVTKVYVEPVSSGDYEVLVSNIEGIQSSLLEQFQLVWKGAVIPIRFQGLRSSIRVLRLDNDGQIYGRLVEMTEVHVLNPKHEQSDEETRSFSEFSFESYGINSSFIKRKFKLQNDMAFVSRNTLANFGLVNNFSELSGLLKYDEKEVLVKLYLDDSVPVCHIFMSDSLFSCLDLKRPSLVMFTWINICQVKEPKRLLVKHKQGISLTLAEKEVRNFANGTDHVFFNEGMQIQLCDTIASLHLDPENLAYCKVRPIILKSIPIVFEEEKEQPQKPVLVKNNVLIEDLHDQQALIDIVLSCLPVDPELHGTPQYLVSGCKFGNILVTGGIGCGKTTFVDQICKKLEGPPFGIKAVYLNCVHWKGKSPVSIFGKLEKIWEDLSKVEPSLLVLDNMDVLFCKTENIVVNNPIEASHTDRIVEKLCSIVENTEKNPRLLIIGIAQSKANLHSKLAVNQGRHFFTYFFELKNPNKMQRLKLLQMICPSFLPGETDENFDELLNRMEGYSAADIKCVAERAFDFSFQRHSSQDLANLKVEYDDVEKSLNGYVPTSLQGISLMKNSTIKWNDIGGLKQVKKTLVETLEWPAKFPKLFTQIPVRLRSGILLYGPSGTGKTMLASAVARECGINFISIKGPELLSKYIGSSEQNVRDTFKQARQASPCILFFDEFDSLAPRRGHDSTGVTDRVVNQLLTELDGVEGPSKGVWVLAASSRPDMIDPALLRPGRLDVSLYCPLPDKEERLDILHILTRSLELDNPGDLSDVASLTGGFSGADLKGLVYDVQLLALESNDDGKIFLQHWTEVLQSSKPSVSQEEVHNFRRMQEGLFERRGVPTKVDQSVTLA